MGFWVEGTSVEESQWLTSNWRTITSETSISQLLSDQSKNPTSSNILARTHWDLRINQQHQRICLDPWGWWASLTSVRTDAFFLTPIFIWSRYFTQIVAFGVKSSSCVRLSVRETWWMCMWKEVWRAFTLFDDLFQTALGCHFCLPFEFCDSVSIF